MPDDVREALASKRVRTAYDNRPPYQRNDYVAWITTAKRPETRAKRIGEMIVELKSGDTYMKMAWHGDGK